MDSLKEKWANAVNVVTIGAGPQEGGARRLSISVGGQRAMPFLFEEGAIPHSACIAMEIWDIEPTEWPEHSREPIRSVSRDPVKWAAACQDKFSADLLCLRLAGAHPDYGTRSAADSAKIVKDILSAVKIPLVILGTGLEDKDSHILPKVAEIAKGEKCLLGAATEKNYKTLTAACIADGHNIIAASPIDINIAKQLNIMITEMGLPADRIVMDPTIGGLGYGIEYGYSIMERARLAALNGDAMLSMPFICFVGQESWRAKEAKADTAERPEWGDAAKRGAMWEIATAVTVLQAGADILVMRHPEAVESVRKHIDELMRRDG